MADTVKGVEIDPVREKLVELLENDYCPLLYVLGDSVGTLADYLIAHGVTVQEWISVKDRLPERFQNVLSYRGHKVLFEVDFIDEQGKWYSECKYSTTEVTHWQPLPQPPKDGE